MSERSESIEDSGLAGKDLSLLTLLFATHPKTEHPTRMRVLPALSVVEGSERSTVCVPRMKLRGESIEDSGLAGKDLSFRLTALFATHPRNPPLSPFIATLPKTHSCKPFACHTYDPLPPLPIHLDLFLHSFSRHSPARRGGSLSTAFALPWCSASHKVARGDSPSYLGLSTVGCRLLARSLSLLESAFTNVTLVSALDSALTKTAGVGVYSSHSGIRPSLLNLATCKPSNLSTLFLIPLKRIRYSAHYLSVKSRHVWESLSMGNPPRSPCAPVGAFGPALNGLGCASPLPRAGQIHGGTVTSPVQHAALLKSFGFAVPQSSNRNSRQGSVGVPADSGSLALTIEFVAKPDKARSAPASLPAAITGALSEVTGFAGCLVMVSDQEARLITVVTFWAGHDSQKCCAENLRWVRALLSSYVDRCLRVQTMIAHLPCSSFQCEQTDSAGAPSTMDESAFPDETVCVA